ncbi:uncharacterized protein [Solanum lycopersicum]|uniref:uncharacterized protein n=1 Tax=Solanum lycopersicum TaxID=4081 RepID=UPI003748FA63
MVNDCLDYARRCQSCQFHANFMHQPPDVLHPTIASSQFDAWDYFSKWSDAVAHKEVKKEHVENFLKVNIMYHFGVPSYILTDNGNPLANKLMDNICNLFGFKHSNSSMYYVAANGISEAFNKILCKLLKKVVSK